MAASLVGYNSTTSVAADAYSVPVAAGLNTQPTESSTLDNNDFIFVASGFSSGGNTDSGLTATQTWVSGVSEIADLYKNSTYDINLSLNFFKYGSGGSSFNVINSATANRGGATMLAIFRGLYYGGERPSNRLAGLPPLPYIDLQTLSGTGSSPAASGSSIMLNSQTDYNMYITGAFAALPPNVSTGTFKFAGATPNLGTVAQAGTSMSFGGGMHWGIGDYLEGVGSAYSIGSWSCDYANASSASWITFIAYFQTGGGVKVGGQIQPKPVKYYNGTSWRTVPSKAYLTTSQSGIIANGWYTTTY